MLNLYYKNVTVVFSLLVLSPTEHINVASFTFVSEINASSSQS